MKEDIPGQTYTFENATHSSLVVFISTESYGEGYFIAKTHSESEFRKWEGGRSTDWATECVVPLPVGIAQGQDEIKVTKDKERWERAKSVKRIQPVTKM